MPNIVPTPNSKHSPKSNNSAAETIALTLSFHCYGFDLGPIIALTVSETTKTRSAIIPNRTVATLCGGVNGSRRLRH
eukprot:1169038-Amorphochlora_amoeboformis.AAC.1